jgi:hypothetical protein
MRTSVDQRAIADIGSSLDRLEAIPTLSLDDFLTFRGGARAGSSDAGAESHHGGGASEPDDARTPATHYDADTDLEVPEEVDPRVQDALEELNLSTTSVNALEGRLSAARKARKQTRLEQEKRPRERRARVILERPRDGAVLSPRRAGEPVPDAIDRGAADVRARARHARRGEESLRGVGVAARRAPRGVARVAVWREPSTRG